MRGGMDFEKDIENEADLMVARVQAERVIAQELLEQARESENYYREKIAAKLVAFLETEEQLLRLYAEAKLYYRPVAEMLESRRPYLVVLYDQATKDWEKYAQIREIDIEGGEGETEPKDLPPEEEQAFHI